MKLTELELKLLLSVPMTFEILIAKMKIENVGTDERRYCIEQHMNELREKMGLR